MGFLRAIKLWGNTHTDLKKQKKTMMHEYVIVFLFHTNQCKMLDSLERLDFID